MMRAVSLGVWATVALALVASEVAAVVRHDPQAGLGELLRCLVGNWRRMIAIYLGWMWLGWHFFAR